MPDLWISDPHPAPSLEVGSGAIFRYNKWDVKLAKVLKFNDFTKNTRQDVRKQPTTLTPVLLFP